MQRMLQITLGACLALLLSCASASAAWQTFTDPLITVTTKPALYRDAEGTLHVVVVERGRVQVGDGTKPNNGSDRYTERSNDAHLIHYTISSNGVASNEIHDLLGRWYKFNDAAVLSDASGMRIYFTGRRTFAPTDTFGTNRMYTATSQDKGVTWKLDTQLSGFTSTYVGNVAAVLDKRGTPYTAWANLSGTFVHMGFGPPTNITEFNNVSNCCGYTPALALDGATGTIWVAYRSNEWRKNGIWVRRVAGGLGDPSARFKLPGSDGTEVDGDVPLATTTGASGKAWVAWCVRGKFGCIGIKTMRLTDRKAVDVVKDLRGAKHVGMTAGKNGSLWVWWSADNAIWVAQSNSSGTVFSEPYKVPLLAKASGFWRLDGNASPSGALDLLASFSKPQKPVNQGTMTGKTQLYYRRIPQL